MRIKGFADGEAVMGEQVSLQNSIGAGQCGFRGATAQIGGHAPRHHSAGAGMRGTHAADAIR